MKLEGLKGTNVSAKRMAVCRVVCPTQKNSRALIFPAFELSSQRLVSVLAKLW